MADLLWGAMRGSEGARRPSAAGYVATLSPIASYFVARVGGSLWEACQRRGRRRSPSEVLGRSARQVRLDVSAALLPTWLAAHPLEAVLGLYLRTPLTIAGPSSKPGALGPLSAAAVRRNVHAAINQLWRAGTLFASTLDALAGADFDERLAWALCHLINAASIMAPYAMLAKMPHQAVVLALDEMLGLAAPEADRLAFDQVSVWQLQAVSFVASTLLTWLVHTASDSLALAEHRFVMGRLAQIKAELRREIDRAGVGVAPSEGG